MLPQIVINKDDFFLSNTIEIELLSQFLRLFVLELLKGVLTAATKYDKQKIIDKLVNWPMIRLKKNFFERLNVMDF